MPLGEAPVPYDQAYFDNYAKYEGTPMGEAITKTRCEMLERHDDEIEQSFVMDVGIGSGAFLKALRKRGWKNAYGIDVNPIAINWLKACNHYWYDGPYKPEAIDVMSFWDVLEHIPDPNPLFEKYQPKVVLVSMPIYQTEAEALASKHFKPGEHCWYFSVGGLIRFMQQRKYRTVEINTAETQLGRKSVYSFAFKRM